MNFKNARCKNKNNYARLLEALYSNHDMKIHEGTIRDFAAAVEGTRSVADSDMSRRISVY